MRESQPQSFPSAADWWVQLILVLVPAITLGTLAVSVVTGEGIWVALLACLFVAGIYGGLVIPVRYTLDEADLVVRFGLVRQRIAYDRIRRVRPTRNPLSSPALSLDRLRVEYGSGSLSFVMISPTPRDEFLAELARLAGLVRQEESLVRVDPPPDHRP